MARRKSGFKSYSRGYAKPNAFRRSGDLRSKRPRHEKRPGWRLADPRFYLSAVIVLATAALVVLPGMADATLAVLRPFAAERDTCRIYQVVDGDTVRMWCPLRGNVSARLTGFDTPELFSPQCASELAAAVRAKWALRHALWQARKIAIIREGTDRYGRALVAVFLDGTPLARRMIADGHARKYDGGLRQTWCA
ncbi:MAG: thermonuclease family protein [Paracoccaceae bacterium]|nr:thermonuclease family protein [Paracoccaceae bacterium]